MSGCIFVACVEAAYAKVMTREQAISVLVAQDVEKWGESERQASERSHAKRTLGLALNELANRSELFGVPNAELRRRATEELTDSDREWLSKGG